MRRVAPLAAALVLTALASSGASGSTAEAPTRAVAIPGKAYEPSHLTVLVGTTVTWKNDDSINHTVTSDGDAFSSGYVPPGGSFSFTFAAQGHYAFHCTIHRFMRGEVDVFGLVLTGPEGPVSAGHRVVFAGLAPADSEPIGAAGGIVAEVAVPVASPASVRVVCSSLMLVAPSSVRPAGRGTPPKQSRPGVPGGRGR